MAGSSTPLISVIIPAHNAEATISKTIQSVLEQTFTDFELIIINDGSQDRTLETISKITDSRVRVFSYENSGASAARNHGLELAQGDYVAFIDADDLWLPTKLELQLKALQENPNASVAYSWTNRIDEAGNFLARGSYISASGQVLEQLLILNFLEHGSNPLIRKQAILEIGGFDTSLQACQDWDLYLRLAAKYLFVAVPTVQILYRVSSHSISSNARRLEAACIKVIKKIYADFPDKRIQSLKPLTIGNLYNYLICKALAGHPSRSNCFLAIRFLVILLKCNPILVLRKVFWKILLKISITILLPLNVSQLILRKLGKLSDINTLQGYLRLTI